MSGFGDGFDFAQEPRKVFVNFLIFNIKLIEQKIFFEDQIVGAIRPLRGLIDTLDAKSKNELKEQKKTLEGFEANVNLITRSDIEEIYETILTYLHGTYLKEANILRAINPKPKHITTKEKQHSE